MERLRLKTAYIIGYRKDNNKCHNHASPYVVETDDPLEAKKVKAKLIMMEIICNKCTRIKDHSEYYLVDIKTKNFPIWKYFSNPGWYDRDVIDDLKMLL